LQRILHGLDLKPHLTRTWKHSRDPEYKKRKNG
jgi:hypothetical protein